MELELVYGDAAAPEDRFHLPRFEAPDGGTLEDYLRELTRAGAAERYGDPLPPEIRDRIDQELGVILRWGSRATS